MPLSSFTNIGGTSGFACFATKASSAPKVGAVCTIPVPSSVVTKSPEMTLNAFSGLSFGKAYFNSCSYLIPTKSFPINSLIMR